MRINYKKPVLVYRNLHASRKGKRPMYSIRQGGRTVAIRPRVLLSNVKFVVREGGRQKVLREKRKNVHAFAKGFLVGKKGIYGTDGKKSGERLGLTIHYNPYYGPEFYAGFNVVKGAGGVLLNENGMTGVYLE